MMSKVSLVTKNQEEFPGTNLIQNKKISILRIILDLAIMILLLILSQCIK